MKTILYPYLRLADQTRSLRLQCGEIEESEDDFWLQDQSAVLVKNTVP